ncbi:unnamed protein product, partial [Prorocentrum cordatum]
GRVGSLRLRDQHLREGRRRGAGYVGLPPDASSRHQVAHRCVRGLGAALRLPRRVDRSGTHPGGDGGRGHRRERLLFVHPDPRVRQGQAAGVGPRGGRFLRRRCQRAAPQRASLQGAGMRCGPLPLRPALQALPRGGRAAEQG